MTVAFVQANWSTQVNTVTFNGNCTKGNLLTVLIRVGGGSASWSSGSVSDSLGNSYTPVWSSIQSPSGGSILKFLNAYYCLSGASGPNVVTLSGNQGGYNRIVMICMEFSGFSSVATLDQSVVLASAGSGSFIPLTFNTTFQNEAIACYEENNSGGGTDPTVNSPFSLATPGQTAGTGGSSSEYLTTNSPGSYTLNGSFTSGSGNTNIAFGFTVASPVPLVSTTADKLFGTGRAAGFGVIG